MFCFLDLFVINPPTTTPTPLTFNILIHCKAFFPHNTCDTNGLMDG